MIASSGRAAISRSRMSVSVATSASLTRSVGVLLDETASTPPNASRSPAPASAATATARSRSSASLMPRAAAAAPTQPESASSCAASDSSVASSPGRPTSCTPTGKPSAATSEGTDAAGCPVWFQNPRNAVKLTIPLSMTGAGRSSHSPASGGRRVSTGVITTSAWSKISFARARSASSAASARRTSGPGTRRPSLARPRVLRDSRSGCAIASASVRTPCRYRASTRGPALP